MRMKIIAKMMPKNSSMVSVRQMGRFSFPRQISGALAKALSHSRSTTFSSRFTT